MTGDWRSSPAAGAKERLWVLEERDRELRAAGGENPPDGIAGTCPDMCPEKERAMRAARRIFSRYEASATEPPELEPELAVKEYARSSADQEEPLPHELRPGPVLRTTMAYLVTRILPRAHLPGEPLPEWYDFLWDRLRALRKDIVQQRLCDLSAVTLVEQCARFHIACYDVLRPLHAPAFDAKINTENLVNCLQSLKHMYQDLRREGTLCPAEPEMTAYTVLLKMASGDLSWEFGEYPPYLRASPEIREAVALHHAFNGRSYHAFFRGVRSTTYLNACILQRHFPEVRARALRTLLKAYRPKPSIHLLTQILAFDTEAETAAFCAQHGYRPPPPDSSPTSPPYPHPPPSSSSSSSSSSLVKDKRVFLPEAVVRGPLPSWSPAPLHSSFGPDDVIRPEAWDASDQSTALAHARDPLPPRLPPPSPRIGPELPPSPETLPEVNENDDDDVAMTDGEAPEGETRPSPEDAEGSYAESPYSNLGSPYSDVEATADASPEDGYPVDEEGEEEEFGVEEEEEEGFRESEGEDEPMRIGADEIEEEEGEEEAEEEEEEREEEESARTAGEPEEETEEEESAESEGREESMSVDTEGEERTFGTWTGTGTGTPPPPSPVKRPALEKVLSLLEDPLPRRVTPTPRQYFRLWGRGRPRQAPLALRLRARRRPVPRPLAPVDWVSLRGSLARLAPPHWRLVVVLPSAPPAYLPSLLSSALPRALVWSPGDGPPPPSPAALLVLASPGRPPPLDLLLPPGSPPSPPVPVVVLSLGGPPLPPDPPPRLASSLALYAPAPWEGPASLAAAALLLAAQTPRLRLSLLPAPELFLSYFRPWIDLLRTDLRSQPRLLPLASDPDALLSLYRSFLDLFLRSLEATADSPFLRAPRLQSRDSWPSPEFWSREWREEWGRGLSPPPLLHPRPWPPSSAAALAASLEAWPRAVRSRVLRALNPPASSPPPPADWTPFLEELVLHLLRPDSGPRPLLALDPALAASRLLDSHWWMESRLLQTAVLS